MSQPSEKYINWWMAPEQAELREAVQKEWEPGIRDVILQKIRHQESETGYAGPYLVVGSDEPYHPERYWRVHMVWIGGYDQWPEIEHRVNVKGFIWIPSLSQWLDMLDAKGLAYELGKFEGQHSITAYQPHLREEPFEWEKIGEQRSWEAMEIATASLWWRLPEVE
jgi:hypothetical protein